MQTLTRYVSPLFEDAVSTFTRMKRYSFVGEDTACNLCGGTAHDVVGSRDRYGKRLNVVLCKGCGLIYVNPMPTDEEVDAFYSLHYRKHYHNAYTPRPKSILRSFRGARGRYEFLKPVLRPGDRVLDVGSGGGEVVRYLRDQGVDAHGIEPNRGFAEYSRDTYDIPVEVAHWQNADIAPGSFDLVMAHHVVEHFRAPYEAMVRFREWIKPDGFLYVSVPQVYSPHRTPYARFHFAHLHYFDRESLVMMAAKAGFELSEEQPGASTTAVFRKTESNSEDWLRHPENYEKMARYFREYTNLRYFMSPVPYTRWCRRVARLGRDIVRATVHAGNPERLRR